jgi:phosphatidylglycerophosphate synthase
MATHDPGTLPDRLYRGLTSRVAVRVAPYRWITPNRVSIAAFVAGGIAAPIAIVTDPLWLAGVAFAVSDFLDYLDGDVARAQGTMSREGDILDGVLDRCTDFLVIGALMVLLADPTYRATDFLIGGAAPISQPAGLILGLAALLGALLPSYITAVTVANGKRTVQSVGGRGTRNRIVIVGLLLGQPLWTLAVVAIVGLVGSAQRFRSSLA